MNSLSDSPLRATVEEIRRVSKGLMDPEFALRTFEFAWDAQIVVNERGLVQFVNTQAELLFGYPRIELWDKHINMLVPAGVREAHTMHLERYFEQPRVRPMQGFRGLNKNGKEFDALIYLVPMSWHDGLLVVATIRLKG